MDYLYNHIKKGDTIYLVVSHLKKIGLNAYHRPILREIIDYEIPIPQGLNPNDVIKEIRNGLQCNV